MENIKVGKSICYLRKKAGMTQKQLAQKIGVSHQAVSKWENGKGAPDITLISKTAEVLDVDVESLLEGNLTQYENKWAGLLFVEYPDEVGVDSRLSDLTMIEYQVSLFMLAGISDICIVGNNKDIEVASGCLASCKLLGVNIKFVSSENLAEISNIHLSGQGVMIIRNLNFLYGKDISRTFRRCMYDSRKALELRNLGGGACRYLFPARQGARQRCTF